MDFKEITNINHINTWLEKNLDKWIEIRTKLDSKLNQSIYFYPSTSQVDAMILLYILELGKYIEIIPNEYIFNKSGFPNITHNLKIENHNLKNKENTFTLYTSGSTGEPKKILYSYPIFKEYIKSKKTIKKTTYSFLPIYHIAGLNCLLHHYLLNGTLFISSINQASEENLLKSHKIATTPTLLKLSNWYLNKPLPNIETVILGGESIDNITQKTADFFYPNAKIINQYGLTETGVVGNIDTLEQNSRVKIFDNNIFIEPAKYILKQYANLTENGFYPTNDQLNNNKNICRNDILNIRGEKIAESTITNALLTHNEVLSANIKITEHPSFSQIIVANILTKNKDIDHGKLRIEIREFLIDQLPYFAIPNKFIINNLRAFKLL